MLQGKLLVAQGGGPTAVINQSLVGAVLEARKYRNVERIYGALHGVRGIVDEEFVDLSQETTCNLELVGDTPAAALGSTRGQGRRQILPGNPQDPKSTRDSILPLYRWQ